jgi:glucose-6-phosphate isomerase
MFERAGEMTAFARRIREEGFAQVFLLGMGGSSLCAEVCSGTLGSAPGFPSLRVLDTTDPAAIRRAAGAAPLDRTLFILASKSGTTIEMQSLFHYFRQRLQSLGKTSPGDRLIAITDHGTPLEALAREERFRRVFLNPSDIGGRYSALSYFGLVPLALMGADLEPFLERALRMAKACRLPTPENPGLSLGAVLGEMGARGRDKVTFLSPPALAGFGDWVEQLLAESTGKEGKGLLPVVGEAAGSPEVYGEDRLFIHIRLSSAPDPGPAERAQALQRAGHPVVEITLRDPLDLAGEFFRWETATAVAGHILGINPFDEPDVTASKLNTHRILEEFRETRRFPSREAPLEEGGIRLYADPPPAGAGSPRDALHRFLAPARPPDYLALLAYLDRSPQQEDLLQAIRIRIRDRCRIATTVGFGPRYLHSTGQFHKGGPNTGLFIQITAEDAEDLPIPGAPYSFSLLKQAQALGDYQALRDRGRRVLEIRLGKDSEEGLRKLVEIMK